jgi:hypothetical protein
LGLYAATRALQRWPDADKRVALPAKMRADARMRPILKGRREQRPHGIEGEIAQGDDQMILVHRGGSEAPLEQTPSRAGVEAGRDVFWMRLMECGWPNFKPDKERSQVICGAYGRRFVEYAIAHRFDEFDRAPEVFASNVRDARRQLWTLNKRGSVVHA